MRSFLVAAVLLLVSCVFAVSLEDAFVKDWALHNYVNLIRPWLVTSDSLLALSESNRLVRLTGENQAITFLIDLSEWGYTEEISGHDIHVNLLDTSFVTYIEGSTELHVFKKDTGVWVNRVKLTSVIKSVTSLSNDSFAILDSHNVLSVWNNGDLGALGTYASFKVFTENGYDYVFADGQLLQLLYEADGLEVNALDANAKIGQEIALKSSLIIDGHHGVSTEGKDVSIKLQVGDKTEVIWTESFDSVLQVKIFTISSSKYLIVVTANCVHAYDISAYLRTHKRETIFRHDLVFNGTFLDILMDESLTVLSISDDKPITFDIFTVDLYSKSKKTFSVPPHQVHVSGKAIIVDQPRSLSLIEKVHHLVEDSQTGTDVLRWLKRTKTHLAQLGRFVVENASGSPQSHLARFTRNLKKLGNPLGLVLGVFVQAGEYEEKFEEDKYGFEKIYIYYDSDNRSIVAKKSKDGSTLWTQKLQQKDNLVDLHSINDEVYVVFSHSVYTLLLRTGEIISEKLFTTTIEKAILVETEISNEKIEEGADPLALALRFGNSLEFLYSETTLADSQFILSQTDDFTLEAYKIAGSKLIQTWKFGTRGEKILAVSDQEGSLTSAAGIARSDRSVLYKYLNPNLVSVVTQEGQSLKVTLLDGITGNVLHIERHSDQIIDPKSINVVQNDNWVVYYYFVKHPKVEQRIVVLDLFSTAENIIGELKSSLNGEFNVTIAQVSAKSFIYPERILQLASTQTKFGLTVRSVIAFTETGQLVEIPKFILNSRRIDDHIMSSEEYEDDFKMMPYEPVIMNNNFQVLNHKIKLQGVEDKNQYILIKPTELESTAVLCFLNKFNEFCTTVQPSLSYDLLNSSFDKLKLSLTIAVLFVVFVLTKPLVDSKKLNAKWLD